MVLTTITNSTSTKPNSYKLVMKKPHWMNAMREEIRALDEIQNWILFVRSRNENIIRYNEYRTIECYKSS